MQQRRWIELVKNYNYTIKYHPGKTNVVMDALSRNNRATLKFSVGGLGSPKSSPMEEHVEVWIERKASSLFHSTF